jgi:hypothetical protein
MFKFDNNYHNLEQVKKFYPKFKKLYDEIIERGDYPYNNIFEGKIKEIEGGDEETAIYLLQSLRTQENKNEIIKKLLMDGYSEIINGDGIKKFKEIIQVGTDYSKDSINKFEDARIIFKNTLPIFIIPRGNKTKGYNIYPGRNYFAK